MNEADPEVNVPNYFFQGPIPLLWDGRCLHFLPMRPIVSTALDATIAHIRLSQSPDKPSIDLDATLEWLEDARETLRLCQREVLLDPAVAVDAIRALRAKWSMRNHALSRSNEKEGRGDAAGRVLPGTADQERDLGGTQTVTEAAGHEPGETGASGAERGEAAAKHIRRDAELIELERYRDQAVNGHLEVVGGGRDREGVEHHLAPGIVSIYKMGTKVSSKSIGEAGKATSTINSLRRMGVSRAIFRLEDGAFLKVESFVRWLGLLQ